MATEPRKFWGANYYRHPPLDAAAVRRAHQTLRVKLPAEYLALLRVKNGGYTKGFHFAVTGTTWADGENPPHTADRFAEDLKKFAASHGLDIGMSALGGMSCRRGDVRRAGADVTESDRQLLASWIRSQRVKCIVRFGNLEDDDGTNQLFQEISELVFTVDNLLPEERHAAAQWRARLGRAAAE